MKEIHMKNLYLSKNSGFVAAYIINYFFYIQLIIALLYLSVVLHAHILMNTVILETARQASNVEGISSESYFNQVFNTKTNDVFLKNMISNAPLVSFRKFDSIDDYLNLKTSISNTPSIVECSVEYTLTPLFINAFSIPIILKMPFSLERNK